MNQKEYTLIANVFARQRATYGGRTDSVALVLLADFIRELSNTYNNFDKVKFYSTLNLTLDEIAHFERAYYDN